jgi:ATP-binding cassette, subfamily C, bacterial LapB
MSKNHSMDFSTYLHLKNKTAMAYFTATIRQRKSIFIEAAIGTLILNIVGLATSIYSMQVYDRVIPTNGTQTLWVLTVGVLLAIMIEFVIKESRSYMVDKACKAIDLELSEFFFSKAIGIRMDARPGTIGTFAAQIRLYESVRNFMTSTTLFFIADIPFALLFIGVIALISPTVAIVPLVLFPIAVLVGFIFKKPIERITNQSLIESTYKNGMLIESIDGIETIKTHQAEKYFLDKWNLLSESIATSDLELKKHMMISTGVSQGIQQISYVGMVSVGVYEIMNGNMTMGGLLATTIISQRALSPAAQIVNILTQWEHSKMALKGLDALMSLPSDGERDKGEENVKPELCGGELLLHQAKFSYANKGAISIPQLAIKKGEKVAIIGPIGSGKSTLLKIFSGLFHPNEGRAFIDHIDMAHLDPAFMRKHIAYMPQESRLFNATLRENLVMGLQNDPGDDAIMEASKKCGFIDTILNHPQGMGMMLTEGGHGMSGGQKQLAALTKLLLKNEAKVLLLDEPSASLDGRYEALAIDALFDKFKACTILYATHKTNLLKHADRIIVMQNGIITADGEREKILQSLGMSKQQEIKGNG